MKSKSITIGGAIVLALLFIFNLFSSSDSQVLPENLQDNENQGEVLGVESGTDSQNQNSDLEGPYPVVKVIDGDTLSIEKDGKTQTLRLIGLNTPETVDPRKPVECFGKEASNKAKELLTGKSIKIEKDASQGDFDKYQRTLAYVFLEDGTNFNKWMLQNGFGYEYTYDLPYKYQKEFKDAQALAKEKKRGLWGEGVCNVSQSSSANKSQNTNAAAVIQSENNLPNPLYIKEGTKQETKTKTETPAPTGKYECSKNTYNCLNFSTQSEAQAAFDACGGTSNDIHQLDRDRDGVVCESLP